MKDFANNPLSQSVGNTKNASDVKQPTFFEYGSVISLSSDDEEVKAKALIGKKPKRNASKKIKNISLKRTSPRKRLCGIDRTTALKGQYHKITEFFSKSKQQRKFCDFISSEWMVFNNSIKIIRSFCRSKIKVAKY